MKQWADEMYGTRSTHRNAGLAQLKKRTTKEHGGDGERKKKVLVGMETGDIVWFYWKGNDERNPKKTKKGGGGYLGMIS